MTFHFQHMDAAESAFLDKQLNVIRAKTYDIKYPQLKAREFIPVDNSLPPGAETVTYHQYDAVGQARLLASYAGDLPRADVYANQFTSQIRGIGASYGYNIQEVRAAQLAGTPLEQRKANAARRAVEEKIEALAKTGDSANGLGGFLNASGVTTYTPPSDGTGASAEWDDKTPDQIVRDMHGIAKKIVEDTKEMEVPDTLLLPLSSYGKVATTRMGDGSDATILDFFLKTSPYIKTVMPWQALETAGANSTKRMVAYRRDPDVLQLVIPQEFEQFPPQQRGLEIVTPCHARCGGVVVYYPLAIAFGDGI